MKFRSLRCSQHYPVRRAWIASEEFSGRGLAAHHFRLAPHDETRRRQEVNRVAIKLWPPSEPDCHEFIGTLWIEYGRALVKEQRDGTTERIRVARQTSCHALRQHCSIALWPDLIAAKLAPEMMKKSGIIQRVAKTFQISTQM